MKTTFDTYCGLSCSTCEYRDATGCKGCIASGGNPFHGKCEIAECAISRGKRFCGECENMPCEILNRYAFDKEHGDEGTRIENLQLIKQNLVAEAREGVDPVSICGHHCDYCFMGQWCGGCRSEYNCCSFAELFENKVCPNVACADAKGLDGCYECDELDHCQKGFYKNTDECVAKATAMFIAKYGKEKYTQTLKKAIDAGVKYAESFNECGSPHKALELLEQYL